MPREFSRTDRIADAIQRELSRLIQFEMRDKRVGMVNINEVEVSRDLGHAKIFVTFVEQVTPAEVETRMGILKQASGFLRGGIARAIDMRTTPQLRFHYDESIERAAKISALVDEVVRRDEQLRDHSAASQHSQDTVNTDDPTSKHDVVSTDNPAAE